ncbi:acyl carrier protein [Saccharothrix ecbatanensis]|jgi:acyl carrier protein|uniref:Acyl carrier protein n=1 Tax=Saccharothrix ecbatanensis TaxID=1105145 RepID=A0A7W9HFA0_9PSEU|nr:acyl carrier protein [Saccharothrix ecbatanensis]MBB5800888.1 acyl carrier protein [Saccharothrix ecbatanensis]
MTDSTATPTIDVTELRELVADVLDLPIEKVTDDAHFVEDLGVDSLLSLELAVSLERHYQIKIESNEVSDVVRMRDVMRLLDGKLAGR